MDLSASLHEHFGFADFRPGQREACEAALAERDVLVVMPTGSGKSLCYQLPGLLRDDLTIVVSPLVALMQDQVEALHARGLGDRVALVNAQQDMDANAAVLDRAVAGELRLLYVAPERFSSPGFAQNGEGGARRAVRRRRGALRLAMGARLPARLLPPRRRRPPRRRQAIVASTATATPRVALDIASRLCAADPLKVATGFDRPNISFAVARPAPHEKRPLIAAALKEDDALPAIVYAGTRAGAEEIAAALTDAARGGGRRLPRRPRPRPRARRCSGVSSPTRCG